MRIVLDISTIGPLAPWPGPTGTQEELMAGLIGEEAAGLVNWEVIGVQGSSRG